MKKENKKYMVGIAVIVFALLAIYFWPSKSIIVQPVPVPVPIPQPVKPVPIPPAPVKAKPYILSVTQVWIPDA